MPRYLDCIDGLELNEKEKKWCSSIEELLMKTPKRFGMYITGDAHITIFDKTVADEIGIEIEDGNTWANHLDIAEIKTSEAIRGLCG